MFSGLTEEARSKAHRQVQTHLEACGQSLHWNPLYPPSCSEPRSGGAGVLGGHPCSPHWLSRVQAGCTGLSWEAPGRPGGQGAPPPHRQGWGRTPARGPRAEATSFSERQFFDVAGLGWEVRGRAPRARLGVSLRPCSRRSPAPQLGVHLKAPLSFLLCKSPSFLISCFVPSCNGTCCYVTSI